MDFITHCQLVSGGIGSYLPNSSWSNMVYQNNVEYDEYKCRETELKFDVNTSRLIQSTDEGLPGCEVTLLNSKLWHQFHDIGTEMIITKSGRRMFPALRLRIRGLDPQTRYWVFVEFALSGEGARHRWAGSCWTAAGTAEPQSSRRVVGHPDSPAPGAHWMEQPIAFTRLKLTNNALDTAGHAVLTSMHRYQPRIHVIRANDPRGLTYGPSAVFTFPETEFMAVTAYQNEKITKLKIDNNPFAKGFRETGQSRCKRKLQEDKDTCCISQVNKNKSLENTVDLTNSSVSVYSSDDSISGTSGTPEPQESRISNLLPNEIYIPHVTTPVQFVDSSYFYSSSYPFFVQYSQSSITQQLISPLSLLHSNIALSRQLANSHLGIQDLTVTEPVTKKIKDFSIRSLIS